MRRIVRGDRHRLGGAEQLTHAADVDDHVVADVDAPVVRERDQVGERRTVGLSGGSSINSSLPFFARYAFSASISCGKKSVFGPGDDQDRGIVRHRALLREHELVGRVVFAAERLAIVL